MKYKIAYLLGRLTGFIFKVWRLILSPINRYRNKRRYKKEMAKLNKTMVNLIAVLANKMAPVMQKAAKDMIKLNEDFKLLEVNK